MKLSITPEHLFCKHLHGLMGAGAYMAWIYEKQEAMKILLFNGAE